MRDNVSQIRTYDTRVANSFTLSGYIIYAYIYIYIYSLGLPGGSLAEIQTCLSPIVIKKKLHLFLAKSELKPLPTLTCIPRESIEGTHTSSRCQHLDSTEPCALSYSSQPH